MCAAEDVDQMEMVIETIDTFTPGRLEPVNVLQFPTGIKVSLIDHQDRGDQVFSSENASKVKDGEVGKK